MTALIPLRRGLTTRAACARASMLTTRPSTACATCRRTRALRSLRAMISVRSIWICIPAESIFGGKTDKRPSHCVRRPLFYRGNMAPEGRHRSRGVLLSFFFRSREGAPELGTCSDDQVPQTLRAFGWQELPSSPSLFLQEKTSKTNRSFAASLPGQFFPSKHNTKRQSH